MGTPATDQQPRVVLKNKSKNENEDKKKNEEKEKINLRSKSENLINLMKDEDRAKLYNTQGGYNVKALITSVEQLKSYREAFTAQEAMRRCRDVRSAYSMVNLYAGSGLDMLAGIRAMFKPIYTAEMDKAKRAALFEVSGVKSYPDVYSVPYEELHRPMYMKITPDCISYSSSNPDPRGRFGESGDNFVRVPEIVARVKPRVVLCEEVANCLLVNDADEVVMVLKGLLKLGYVVHANVLSAQQFGDIINKWRLIIIAISEDLGVAATSFRIPTGSFSDSVSYCAEDVVLHHSLIPKEYVRTLKDKILPLTHEYPGQLMKVGQVKPGHGYSTNPHAVYSLSAIGPACTRHGAGRHTRHGYTQGDTIGETYMFTPEDVAMEYSLSTTVLDLFRKYAADEHALYDWLGGGFTMRFGTELDEAVERMLQLAGVRHDIETTRQNGPSATHVFTDEVNQSIQAFKVSKARKTCEEYQASYGVTGDENAVIRTMLFDTGASEILVHDDQDCFLKDKFKSSARIIGATSNSNCEATSEGDMLFGIISAEAMQTVRDSKKLIKSVNTDLTTSREMLSLLQSPVVTVQRDLFPRQLCGFKPLFKLNKLNLDIRQYKQGKSCLWKVDEVTNQRTEYDIRYDAVDEEWVLDYINVRFGSSLHNDLVKNHHRQLILERSVTAVNESRSNRMEANAVYAFANKLLKDNKSEEIAIKVVTERSAAELEEFLPDDKRIEIIYAQQPEEREIRGVKQRLPKASVRNMAIDDYHSSIAHIGCGKNCRI